MRLGIPSPPRPVSLAQVPGALPRLALAGGVGLVAVGALGLLGSTVGRWLSTERDFFERAVEVQGQLTQLELPSVERRDLEAAKLTVIYAWEGKSYTASQVEADANQVEGLGRGAAVSLLVDPAQPSRPREKALARSRAGLQPFGLGGVGLGLVVAGLLLAREARRAVRRELEPLRRGLMVWLTPAGDLPDTRRELVFKASYWRDDREHQVQARARPGRAPVRNGAKLLAAVVPTEPTWVRVIDEDLAKALGWFVD